MEDRDFFEALKTPDEQSDEWTAAAEEFVRLKRPDPQPEPAPETEKTAGIADLVRDPKTLGAMGATALLLGGGTYLTSKPRADLGGKSSAEVNREDAVRGVQERGEEGAGLLRKIRNRQIEFEHGLAKAFREHPRKAALLGGLSGASVGAIAAKILGAGRR